MVDTQLPSYLRDYAPSVHPLKQFFAERGVSQLVLANYLKRSPSWISAVLNGYRPMPSQLAWKLSQLAQRLDQEGREGQNG